MSEIEMLAAYIITAFVAGVMLAGWFWIINRRK